MEISILTECYLKLKNYIYHDKSLLYAKDRIAEFEKGEGALPRLAKLHIAIEQKDTGYFSNLIEKCRFHEVPKDFSFVSDKNDFVTNSVYSDKWTLDSTNLFLDIPVELHILNIYWIIGKLYLLENIQSEDSYGYRLELRDRKVKGGKKLFQPYFDNYTKWLRSGFNCARRLSQESKSYLLITLDIKRFFYSVRISKAELQKATGTASELVSDSDQFILSINLRLHDVWRSRVSPEMNEDLFSLPLGVLSSGILANWYLRQFDNTIKGKLSPDYFGRYVDDIIIVKEIHRKRDFSSTKEIIDRTFVDIAILKQSSLEGEYAIANYENLKIQSAKVKAFIFHGKESRARVDHLASSIISNSSEFNLMPDIHNIFTEFDQMALDIQADGANFKLRDIEDVIHDRFKVSQLLSRVLILHKHCNLTPREKSRISIGFQRIFKGKHIIWLRPLWTQYLTLMTIQESHKNFEIFLIRLDKLLKSMMNNTENEYAIDCLIQDISISVKIALCGNVNFYQKFIERNGNRLNRSYSYVKKILMKIDEPSLFEYRKSFLMNFQLFRTSAIFLYAFFYDHKGNLYLHSPDATDTPFARKEQLTFLPKYVQFMEIYQALLFRDIHRGNFKRMMHKRTNGAAIALYWQLNFRRLFPISFFTHIKSQYFNAPPTEEQDSFFVQRIDANSPRFSDQSANQKIAIPNHKIELSEIENMLVTGYRSQLSYQKFLQVGAAINAAVLQKANFLIFPELAIPIEFLPAIVRLSQFFQIAIVAGLEYIVYNDTALNLSISIIPGQNGTFKYAKIYPRIKNYYAPAEIQLIRRRNFRVPANIPLQYFLFKWQGVQFTVFNCYELTNIRDRGYFKGRLDFLITVLFNRDRHYYESIAQSAVIDLHCFLVNVNTSIYKGTFAIQPASTNTMYIAELKGGENPAILIVTLEIDQLREFQRSYLPGDNIPENFFKPLPPDFQFDNNRY